MKSALVIVLNPFVHDSRVQRQAEALVTGGYRAEVFALHEKELPTDETRPGYRVRRFSLRTRPWPKNALVQGIKYLECFSRMTLAGVRLKPNLIHANDVNALPIGYMVAKITKSKLVYDSHELWSDPTLCPVPIWLFKMVVALEAFLARRADAVITVNDSIAKIMAAQLKIPVPTVIRNVPRCTSERGEERALSLRSSLGLTRECPVILYIGALIWGRGLEVLIDAMMFVDPPAVAVLLGPHQRTSYLNALKHRVLERDLRDRVCFHPPVSSESIVQYARDATIGVAPSEGSCLSYRYGIGNKVFECLQAGLPLVVSDLPEMSMFVRRYGVGETFPDRDPKALACTLNRMLSSPESLEVYRLRVAAASRELTWSNEEPKLLSVYDSLCPRVECTSRMPTKNDGFPAGANET